jgi:uncharacterized protein YcnI
MKKIPSLFLGLVLLLSAATVSAHAVVSPKEANVGEFKTFTLGVPSEKASTTVSVKLAIPEGLDFVTPNVKPGWKIDITKSGDKVSEISWTGGSIPSGQRDEFLFSAKVPSQETKLQWKVYQKYADGSEVAWDQEPNANVKDFSKSGPYSVTSVINDLAANKDPVVPDNTKAANTALVISTLAVIIAIVRGRKRNA